MAWVEDKVAIELEGGIFTKGRTGHSSVTGICRDMEKANAATLLGWKILRYHSKDLEKRPRQVIEEIVLLLSQDGAHSVAKS